MLQATILPNEKQPSLVRNASANVLQMLFSAGMLFFLYRYVIDVLGVSMFGVWSVVLAAASTSRLADLGLSAGTTRFVARYLALKKPQSAAKVIETSFVTIVVILLLILPIFYLLLVWLLSRVLGSADLIQALEILPLALGSLFLSIVASVFQGGLDGCQRMDIRAWLVLAGQGFMTLLAIFSVSKWGLSGLAWSQIGQGCFLIIGSWILLRHVLPSLSIFPWKWDKLIFLEMLVYCINMQIAGICMMLFDPLAKALMAKYGGSAAAGYFEIANQVVLKVRSLIVVANQAVVPKVSEIYENFPQYLPDIYKKNLQLLIWVSLPCFTLLFIWSGIFSLLILGKTETQFILFLQICTVAWFLNTFNAPAYFINSGSGAVGFNTLSGIVMGVVNLILGFILGQLYGAKGVAFGYAIALVTGSWLLIITFQLKYSISWRSLVFKDHFGLAIVCLAILFLGSVDLESLIMCNDYVQWGVIVVIPLILLSIANWYHPQRQSVWRSIKRQLLYRGNF